jgi:thioredoxin reductase
MPPTNHDFDCVIVGGGAAGLSAAMVLGRRGVSLPVLPRLGRT